MKKYSNYSSAVVFFLVIMVFSSNAYDINIIGHVAPASSLSRHATSFIECLSPDVPIKFFKTSHSPLTGKSSLIDEVLARGVSLCTKSSTPSQRVGYTLLTGISMYTDSFLW